MTPATRRYRCQTARFEIYPDAGGWRWRFFDGLDTAPFSSRLLTREQCFKALQIVRNTISAPVFVVR